MNARPLILVVDDDDAIRSALLTLLTRAGFDVQCAVSGPTAMEAIRERTPALVLLDVVLDETRPTAMSGLDVLREVRTLPTFIPVIMLTSFAEWQVESLGHGAIAFIVKPWDANGLIGQIRATLNAVQRIREETRQIEQHQLQIIQVRDVHIDMNHLKVTRDGHEIDLTPLEFALLAFLARHPSRDWTREELLDQVWGYEWAGYSRTVDRHIASLRRKLKLGVDELIETVHTVGYRLTL